MGVIIKYQVELHDIGVKLSNDAFAGNLIIDADIKAQMARGVAGSTFEMKLYDLPQKKADALYEKVKTGKPGKVTIKLGYMDSFSSLPKVMEGLFTKVTASVQNDRLVTVLQGMETGTHALTKTQFQKSDTGKKTIKEAVSALLSDATIVEGDIDREPRCTLTDTLDGPALRGDNLLEILDDVAQRAGAELLVADKRVSIGKPIEDNDYKPKRFTPDTNLAAFVPFTREVRTEENINRLEPIKPKNAIGFSFTIAGDGKLRPGHKVLTNVKGYEGSEGDFRVHSLVHNYSSTTGYVCEGIALKVCSTDECRDHERALTMPTADGVVQSLSRRIQKTARTRPSIEVAAVKKHDASTHRATLYFGQRFRPTETQPSVRAEVDQKDDQVLAKKPLVSPFAWRKCGLITPVYPGMKAAVLHNLDLPDDALVAGFLWSETPAFEPPSSNEGDWWLCLPIDFAASAPPTDGTKAVSDLIANNGHRVISAKGLRITIGSSTLDTVGTRPTEGADDELLIEHSSGTKLTISKSGELSIEASKVSIKGNLTIDGSVEIT